MPVPKGTRVGHGHTHFQIGFHSSYDGIMITIPDKIHFPSTHAWVWLVDAITVGISPNKPMRANGAVERKWSRTSVHGIMKDYRQLRVDGMRLTDCNYFGLTPIAYEHLGNNFFLKVPGEADRKPVKSYRGRHDANTVEHLPPKPRTKEELRVELDRDYRAAIAEANAAPSIVVAQEPSKPQPPTTLEVLIALPDGQTVVCDVPMAEAFALARYRRT